MRTEEGFVKKFVQEDSHRECREDSIKVPDGYIGLACDVAPMPGEINMHRTVFDQLRYQRRND